MQRYIGAYLILQRKIANIGMDGWKPDEGHKQY